MRAKEVINILDGFCNPKLIDDWDNTGFQIGNSERDIKRILIALDLDEPLAEKAIAEEFHMIITHHPIIFKPIKSITSETYLGKLLMNLISNEIVVYNAHSNLDMTVGGVNDELAKLLDLENTKPLNMVKEETGVSYGYGRVGTIKSVDGKIFIENLKRALKVEDVRVYGDLNKVIKRVAVCGGSGGDFVEDAYFNRADIYITGDVKYHEAQLGLQLGIILVDAGHFNTEKIVLPVLKDLLIKEIKEEIHIELSMDTSVSYKIY